MTAFSVLQGVCSSLLRLHTLRPRPPRLARPPSAAPQANAGRAWLAGELKNAAKSAIADFRFYLIERLEISTIECLNPKK